MEDSVMKILYETIYGSRPDNGRPAFSMIADWNDEHTAEEVVEMLERAATLADERGV